MKQNSYKNLLNSTWDVVVVGTGIGGATIGWELARSGMKVLFLEKGKNFLLSENGLRGDFAETFFPSPSYAQSKYSDILMDSGRWWEEVYDLSVHKIKKFIPFIGCGTGGSSILYGGAMERFFPEDLTPIVQKKGDFDESSSLPDYWPISYKEIAPYYEKAEKLYGVKGTRDPLKKDMNFSLSPPPPMLPAAEELFDFFLQKGLHPYRLPIAVEFKEGCEGCQGFICPHFCKNDSLKVCLYPALTEFGAGLVDQCEVISLEEENQKVKSLICIKDGLSFKVKAKIFILAAGALITPLILLNSVNKNWPNGLGNNNGLIGKNLMRHHIDLYAIFVKNKTDLPSNKKDIAFNDFYNDEFKLGTVQSFGLLPPANIIVEELFKEIHLAGKFFKIGKYPLKIFLKNIFSRSILLASIKEDLPYEFNKVELLKGGKLQQKLIPVIKYQLSRYERSRINIFRKKLKRILKPYRFLCLKQSENNERIAHVCGTCRFGEDPDTSVLNKYNQVHTIENLFVVDSSFFPSSGGTNPSLTIAANALRVAKFIKQYC